MPIPHIIHQTWKNYDIPAHLFNYVKSWIAFHPNWQYCLWTDDLAAKFVYYHYPWFYKYYLKYSSNIMRADVLRYMLLHYYGGIYADLDYECYKSFQPLTEFPCLLFGWEWEGAPKEAIGISKNIQKPILIEWVNNENTLGNAIMGSCPRHPFWMYVLNHLIKEHPGSRQQPNRSIWQFTGPAFITQIFTKYFENNWNTLILPQNILFPIYWHPPSISSIYQNDDFPDAYGAHHWAGTWWQPQPVTIEKPKRIKFLKKSISKLDN